MGWGGVGGEVGWAAVGRDSEHLAGARFQWAGLPRERGGGGVGEVSWKGGEGQGGREGWREGGREEGGIDRESLEGESERERERESKETGREGGRERWGQGGAVPRPRQRRHAPRSRPCSTRPLSMSPITSPTRPQHVPSTSRARPLTSRPHVPTRLRHTSPHSPSPRPQHVPVQTPSSGSRHPRPPLLFCRSTPHVPSRHVPSRPFKSPHVPSRPLTSPYDPHVT